MTVVLVIVAVSLVYYVGRFAHHHQSGLKGTAAVKATVREEVDAREAKRGFTKAEQHRLADELRERDTSLSIYRSLREARKQLSNAA